MKKKVFKNIIITIFCVGLLLCGLVSCSKEESTDDDRFDYFASQISNFVEISAEDYAHMVAKLPKSYLISDEVVESYIKKQLFSNKTQLNGGESQIDQPVRYGDTAYIYYEGFMDGVAFDGGSNMTSLSPYALSIGSGTFIDGFEDQLIGVVPNETSKDNRVSVRVTFPEVYAQNPSYAGKDAEFLVYIVRVVQYQVPTLNDDTIKNILKYTPTEEGATDLEAEYREYVKKNLETANSSGKQNAAINDLLEQLTQKATFKQIPESELEYYRKMYVDELNNAMEYYTGLGYSFADLDDFVCQYLGLEDGADWGAKIREISTIVIKQHLVCHAIAQIENIELTDQEYEAEIKSYITQASYSGETITRDEVIETVGEYTLRESAMYSKVCQFLYDNCTVAYED